MKVIFGITKYSLAAYGLLVFLEKLHKVVTRSSNADDEGIREPILKEVKVYGRDDPETFAIYSFMNDCMTKNGVLTYSNVKSEMLKHGVECDLEMSDEVGWDESNYVPVLQFDPADVGGVVIYLPEAKKLAQ